MSNPTRTKAEAVLKLKYSIRLHHLHCRLYGRLKTALAAISLLAGSAAFLSVVQAMPGVVAAMGVIIAAASYADVLVNLSGKAVLHNLWRRQYAAIDTKMQALDLSALDAALAEVAMDTEEGIEALRAVAYNDTLKSFGHEDGMRPENRMERFVRAIA